MSNPRDWEDLASRLDGVYTVEDFETAAYRLVAEQVIYHSDRSSRAWCFRRACVVRGSSQIVA